MSLHSADACEEKHCFKLSLFRSKEQCFTSFLFESLAVKFLDPTCSVYDDELILIYSNLRLGKATQNVHEVMLKLA